MNEKKVDMSFDSYYPWELSLPEHLIPRSHDVDEDSLFDYNPKQWKWNPNSNRDFQEDSYTSIPWTRQFYNQRTGDIFEIVWTKDEWILLDTDNRTVKATPFNYFKQQEQKKWWINLDNAERYWKEFNAPKQYIEWTDYSIAANNKKNIPKPRK